VLTTNVTPTKGASRASTAELVAQKALVRVGPGGTNAAVVCNDSRPNCAEREEEGHDCWSKGSEFGDAGVKLES
jgi:hypothetical protein